MNLRRAGAVGVVDRTVDLLRTLCQQVLNGVGSEPGQKHCDQSSHTLELQQLFSCAASERQQRCPKSYRYANKFDPCSGTFTPPSLRASGPLTHRTALVRTPALRADLDSFRWPCKRAFLPQKNARFHIVLVRDSIIVRHDPTLFCESVTKIPVTAQGLSRRSIIESVIFKHDSKLYCIV